MCWELRNCTFPSKSSVAIISRSSVPMHPLVTPGSCPETSLGRFAEGGKVLRSAGRLFRR